MEHYYIKRSTVFLGLITTLLSCYSALDGLFEKASYTDLPIELSNFLKGHDLVTLLVIVPLLLLSILLSRRGFRRAYIVMVSVLLYVALLYISEFLIFLSFEFRIFPVLIVLIAGSGFINALINLDLKRLHEELSPSFPHRFFSISVVLSGVALLVFWLFIISISPSVYGSGIAFFGLSKQNLFLISMFDIFVFLPLAMISGFFLWKNTPLGYPLASFYFAKVCLSTLSYIFVSVFIFYYALPLIWEITIFFCIFLIMNSFLYRRYLRVVEDI